MGKSRVLGLAALLVAVGAGAGEAATKISECRKITESGSYLLTRNLPGPNGLGVNDGCLVITANHVTLDLGGYEIKGNPRIPAPGYGIFMQNRKNVTILNGTVRSFSQGGIVGDGIVDGSVWIATGKSHRISNVRAIKNGGEGILLEGSGHSVTNSLAAGNGWTGIVVPEGSTLIGNTAVDNFGGGIDAGPRTSVRNNTANNNGFGGIWLHGDNFVDGNSALGNPSGGIWNCGTCTYGVNLGVDP